MCALLCTQSISALARPFKVSHSLSQTERERESVCVCERARERSGFERMHCYYNRVALYTATNLRGLLALGSGKNGLINQSKVPSLVLLNIFIDTNKGAFFSYSTNYPPFSFVFSYWRKSTRSDNANCIKYICNIQLLLNLYYI
jgi:hypothetical protein